MDGGQAQFDKFVGQLDKSKGSAKSAADIMRDNLNGSLDELSGAAETAQISIGNALTPAIRGLTDMLAGAVNAFNNMSPGMQQFIVIGAIVSAALLILGGGVLLIISLIPAFTAGFEAIAFALETTSAALAVTIGWILLIIAAVVAIGVGLYKAYQNVEWFRDAVNAAWAQIKEWWNTAITWILGITQQVMSAIGDFIGTQLDKIKKFWAENGTQILEGAKNAFDMIKAYIQMVMGVIGGIFQVAWSLIVGIVQIAWGVLKNIVGTGIDVVLGIIKLFAKLFTGDWQGAFDAALGIVRDIWHGIVGIFNGIDLVGIGKNVVQGLINGLSSMMGSVSSMVKKIADKIPQGIKDFLGIHSPSRVLRELGQFAGKGLGLGIEDTISFVNKSAENMAEAAVPDLSAANAAGSYQVVSRTSNESADTGKGSNGSGSNTSDSGNLPQINVETMVVREEADIRKIAQELYKLQLRSKRAKGAK